VVERVKTEAAGLLRAAASAGVAPTGEVPSPAADGFGAEHAGTLSAAIPKVGCRAPRARSEASVRRSSSLSSRLAAPRLNDSILFFFARPPTARLWSRMSTRRFARRVASTRSSYSVVVGLLPLVLAWRLILAVGRLLLAWRLILAVGRALRLILAVGRVTCV
jgi:hypothetical protein